MSTDRAERKAVEHRARIGLLGDRGGLQAGALLTALEGAFPVTFEQAEKIPAGSLAGVLAFDQLPARVPAEVPVLVLPSGSGELPRAITVELADAGVMARPLRGRTIGEELAVARPPFAVPDEALVLAAAAGAPVLWQLRDSPGPILFSPYPRSAPSDGEPLTGHLRSGRFMGLLPLVQLILLVLAGHGWSPPPLRAAFVIDDPNLHWPSYGFIDYAQVIEHATRHGYHVALATVPLDGWLVNRRAARLLRENPATLSLLMHGSEHVAAELGRLRSDAAAEGSIARALVRVRAMERRGGVAVDRVMAPPHGACSEEALRAMFRLGVEAACISRPYPWRDHEPSPTALAGWRPAEMVAGGIPVLPRYFLGLPREDLAFRALLGQPLILYGHHGDLADGLEPLAEAAAFINGLGEVRWGPIGEIASSNYTMRRDGDTLHIQMYARRVSIELPGQTKLVHVELQEPLGGAAGHTLWHGAGASELRFAGGSGTATFERPPDGIRLELTLAADDPLRPADLARRGFRPWPLARRLAVEGRDRIQPLLARS
jgi:hypothetical protein